MKEVVKNILGKTANAMMKTVKSPDPPDCWGWIYQPERPKMDEEESK